MPEPGAQTEAAMPVRFLTFRVREQSYAVRAEDVAEIIRVPPAAHVPQSPKALLGIANLRGVVLPVVSLRALLGMAEGTAGPTARAIVLDTGNRVGLVVDVVDALVEIAADKVDSRQAQLGADAGERAIGVFQARADGPASKILDIAGLLDAAFARRARPARQSRTVNRATTVERVAAENAKAEMLVTFEVAGQEFALNLEAVQEVLPAPATRTAVPRAEALVLGMTALRGALLPLLSLRGLLGFPVAAAADAREKVVVMNIAGAQVGLVADRARAIVAARPELIDTIPPVLAARSGGESRIKAIYRAEAGRRLISILAPEQLFREDVMQRLSAQRGEHGAQSVAADETRYDAVNLLVFRLGNDEYALPVDSVEEVAQVPAQITRLPKTPRFMEGVVNLRGAVLPVIDQRRRFDMPVRAEGKGRRLVVVRTERHRAGLIVDSVSDVLRVRADAVESAPQLTDEIAKLVRGVINLPHSGRIVLLLDPPELLSRAERRLLDSFQAETAQANV
ncbi:MAG TPA: chemotaxis protein CheW [Burkholderiales bacterium]|nr:chemotaxis protein CheW [Burkholderiales bacterium]